MSPRQIAFVSAVAAEEGRRDLVQAAIAGRLAQADQKGWERALKDLGDE